MIVSVSRRTDIPAFYSDWFIDKIEQGFLYVMNPFNRKQISKIILTPDTVDCFVFWTKDAAPMMDKLHILNEMGFKYYFQFTLTPYDKDIEPEIRSKDELCLIHLCNYLGLLEAKRLCGDMIRYSLAINIIKSIIIGCSRNSVRNSAVQLKNALSALLICMLKQSEIQKAWEYFKPMKKI